MTIFRFAYVDGIEFMLAGSAYRHSEIVGLHLNRDGSPLSVNGSVWLCIEKTPGVHSDIELGQLVRYQDGKLIVIPVGTYKSIIARIKREWGL